MFYTSSSTAGLARVVSRIASCSFFVCLIVTSCARNPAPPIEEEYSGSYSEGAVFIVRNGCLEPLGSSPIPEWEGLPASVAPDAAAVVAPDGRSAFVAVNRGGLTKVVIDPAARRYRLEKVGAAEEFPGRSVGGLFRRGGDVFCLLYRDSLFETEAPRDSPALLLYLNTAEQAPVLKPYDLNLGEESKDLFALFPLTDGSWMLQLRRDVPRGVESEFRSFNPEAGALNPLDRSTFERNLTPRPMASAPAALRGAALLLAPEGCPVVVSASLADGSRSAFTFGDGKPEDSVELRGAVTEAGTALVSWNAVGAVVRNDTERAFRLPLPVEGAVYRDIVPLEGAVLALWEVGVFPNVEESGAVLFPTP